MKTYSFTNIQKFTSKYGTIRLRQDSGGVVAEAKKAGFFTDDTIWEEGPFTTVLEAMNHLDEDLGKWLKDQWW